MTADPEKVPYLTPDELLLEAAYLEQTGILERTLGSSGQSSGCVT